MRSSDNDNTNIGGNGNGTGEKSLVVAGLGASAGGIEALMSFCGNVPPGSGIAYVVILHLSPNHDSKLAEVLQSVSNMRVSQVTKETKLEADCVYVVPPDQHLTIEGQYLKVSKNVNEADRHAPVDLFLRSLAEAYGPNALCAILSGTGANGSSGLKRIKERGGAVFVQNPREAEFNEMPRNAIATDMVDEVLPVAEIPRRMIEYTQSMGSVEIPIEPQERTSDEQFALREIFSQLRIRTGHDFTNYKRPTLLRRIERRISVRNQHDLAGYAAFIQQNHEESMALLKDLLISVTNFFRDKKAFEVLEHEVIPSVLKDRSQENIIRVWVAGCATGEEAYSIAILFAEQLQPMIGAPKVQIFATDIDEAAIAHAREGLYSINEAADVSPERLRNFFQKDGDLYRVRREIREMIMFATHNVITDPPFSRIDIISCRNVLIYLNNTAQERVLETFHFALKPGGYLFLGTSESTDGARDLYITYSREQHIFKSQEAKVSRYPIPMSVPNLLAAAQNNIQEPNNTTKQRSSERAGFGELHQILLEKYAPPSVLIDEDYKILHLSDRAGRYLQIAGGEPTHNVLKLVRHELRLELRYALLEAAQKQGDVEGRGTKLMIDDQEEVVKIHVRPIFNDDQPGTGYFLVLFEKWSGEDDGPRIVVNDDEPLVRQLEEEVQRLKTQLRTTNEQHEFKSEELKAANEELQAMNEETRSAAEELETSKEELQSINEELRTVNQELKVKVEETTIASNNLQNLINSVDLATIFLDRGLRVKLFTPAARRIFNLIPSDNARLLSDITSQLEYKDVVSDAQLALESLQTIEKEVNTVGGTTYLMRVLPYRTQEDRINGVVITFFDIMKAKSIEYNLRNSEESLRMIIENARDFAIFTIDRERRVNSWNSGAETVFGYKEEEILGKSGDIFFIPEDRAAGAPVMEAEKAEKEGRAENERWHLRKDGSHFYGSGMVRPLFDSRNQLMGYLKIMRDLTEDKRAEEALRESEERLRITMNSATDYAIITLNLNGTITSWSKGAENILQYLEGEVVGKHASIIFTQEDIENNAPQHELGQAISDGRAFDERWHVRKDGSRLFMSGVMTPIMNNQSIIGFVKVARDITDKKLIEEQKDEFIGIASHELKTPVTSIKAYSELLKEIVEENNTEQTRDLVDKLDNQVNRLIELIHALLDTTRITRGNLPFNFTLFDLNALAAERVREVQHITPIHKITFERDNIGNIVADAERIGQVITNLLMNAVKYSPDGGKIFVSTKAVRNGVQLVVTDSGVGIPEKLQSKIFDRFYRVYDTHVPAASGMGLGLYICSAIVEAHGGSIGVDSRPGKGSTFTVKLPLDASTRTTNNSNE